ncbi:aldo/keto reductase, partial [Rhodovulum adriaticum]|uniref:aldo/keto reductase n=1 Tax=Rhodovulum adriaticum TaxID=35804 RepID=UPI00190487B0
MKNQKIGKSNLEASRLILGCMRMSEKTAEEAKEIIEKAFSLGINHIDHADIYGGGKSEKIFSKALKLTDIQREDLVIQSKCGIRQGMYDFSYEYIMKSVAGILKRLDIEYLDILLLHRPDTLMEPDEIARAFNELKEAGRVKHFGLSNCNTGQIKLIQKYL